MTKPRDGGVFAVIRLSQARCCSLIKLLKRTCILLLLTAVATPSPAQIFATVATFDAANGAFPYFMSLVQGIDGHLYGTTAYGGSFTVCGFSGCGTIFKITSKGALSTEYIFCPEAPCTNGNYPASGFLLAIDGNLYGTTDEGGAENWGSVYKFTPNGTLTTLYSFCAAQGACVDGGEPYAPLIQATDGNFYGMTTRWGANEDGTFYKVTPNGELTTLYNLDSQDAAPFAAPVQGPDGNFYGTSPNGGAHNSGSVFKVTPGGTPSILYSFCAQSGCPDGAVPFGGLVLGANGKFYGTTDSYGANSAGGTIFEITPSGELTTLYSFCAQTNCSDGTNSESGLIQATDGNLYGTTAYGANTSCNGGCGTIFKITPSGALTTLHSFDLADGAVSTGGLFQATDGNLYGTTAEGGGSAACYQGCGTVFRLSLGLNPFVETLPTIRWVGAHIFILGNNLTGSTAVSFNGTSASFTVVSNTGIRATVPVGATTGFVTVTTPSGILTSNKPFRVFREQEFGQGLGAGIADARK